MSDNWIKKTILTDIDGIDAVTNALSAAGIDCIETHDPRDAELMMQSPQYWDYIDEETAFDITPGVTVYIAGDDEELLAAFESAVQSLTDGGINVRLEQESIAEEDWANNWKKYYKPLPIGERLIIKPSWETVEDAGGRTVLELDPSVSFGTGGHATTRLCLELLEKHVKDGCALLDIGCGSGILFTAGMLLGAGSAKAVDIEADAVRTSRENAERNGVADIDVYRGNVLEDAALCDTLGYGKYDILTANIIADVIMAMLPLFCRFLKDGGRLLASGIIVDRREETVSAIAAGGFDIEEVITDGEWVAVSAVKKA